jgi:hypothetical protein
MYELGLPEDFHIAVPENSEPQELFILTVGTLGDVAATLCDAEDVDVALLPATVEELDFSASFFDAFIESRFSGAIARDTALLAASAYYLARRPGSSLVLARQLKAVQEDSPVDKLLHWTLLARWADWSTDIPASLGQGLGNITGLLASHFHYGSGLDELFAALTALRRWAYAGASARDLLFIDIIAAIIRLRIAASVWITLPRFTGLAAVQWAETVRKPHFPKELWPSQMLLGEAGLFSGVSGIVQMPTSAGKTRSIEIMLRSGFLSGRANVAVVVAPFRALCHEIGTSLRHAFREDNVKVNELSDAMQLDFLQQVAELLGSEAPTSRYILVLTPEKLVYVLRQTPTLIAYIGVVVYDEGHQFDSGSRGIVYELLLTQIKTLLPPKAQTVLVSAVIQNPEAIGKWLMGDTAQVVDGRGLLPTARSTAFASWIEHRGQLMFFESHHYGQPDYFVPRVIDQQKLDRHSGERKEQFFPRKSNSNDVALYLGIRLAPQGAVAIFCGRKSTASAIATRAVEVYERGFSIATPAAFANYDELRRMKSLVDGHFGDKSILSRAATLGVFVHHGTTPYGLRLSIEYAMQQSLINFVACTSTLAQGVNLPIRYLIVSGIHQGREKIKVREFQNLVGRAGRSGMHTEGLIIFSDPEIYDTRLQQRDSWKFNSSVELLSPDRSEGTTSALLGLLAPLRSTDGRVSVQLSVEELCELLLSDEVAWAAWSNDVVRLDPHDRFDAKTLVAEIRTRRRLIFAIESYLMANRGVSSFDEFKSAAEQLASSTLAYHLAPDELKPAVKILFLSIVQYLQQQQPGTEKQAIYSKTLLGMRGAKAVEQWVSEKREMLLTLDSNENWLKMVWELFSEQSDDKFFHSLEPRSLAIQLAARWIEGRPYLDLFAHSSAEQGTKPWGPTRRRRVTDDDIVEFCESTLGFECSLVLAAVAQFLFQGANNVDPSSAALTLFQKSLKYGLPDVQSVSCYESGFADRVVAQRLCDEIRLDGFSGKVFSTAFASHRDRLETVLEEYPSYFQSVLAGLT